MLKFQSFKVKDHDKINEFLKTHIPYSTAEQGGIMLHNGYIVIKWDDGIQDDQREVVNLLRKRIDESKGKLLSIEVEQRLMSIQIEQIKPTGYKGIEDVATLKSMYKEEGYKGDEANTLSEQLNHFRQTNFINTKEIERLQHTIKVMNDMVEEGMKHLLNDK